MLPYKITNNTDVFLIFIVRVLLFVKDDMVAFQEFNKHAHL